MRVGSGYDIHKFRTSGTLRLGGIDVPDAPQLDGHSDGDTLIHAIVDALLGAAGEADIGTHFPPGDPETASIDSREILRKVTKLITQNGYSVNNIDATIIAERPHLATHMHAMRNAIAQSVGIDVADVNVKATTHEGIGSIGAGEAIAALAVVLLGQDVA